MHVIGSARVIRSMQYPGHCVVYVYSTTKEAFKLVIADSNPVQGSSAFFFEISRLLLNRAGALTTRPPMYTCTCMCNLAPSAV